MADWDLAKWLEALAYLVAVLGAIFGAILFLVRLRRRTIDATREIIARAWTNEGDIHSCEPILLTLELANHDGDLIGSVSSSAHERLLELRANVGWFKTTVHISELLGRNRIPIGSAAVKVTGNRNRLRWRLERSSDQRVLPVATVLWPSPVGVQ